MFRNRLLHHGPRRGASSQRSAAADINAVFEGQRTRGDRAADRVAAVVGSWRFLIVQSVMLTVWVIVNVAAWTRHWDPYPFILMNLLLSLQAAYAAPIIMMSQNRQAAKDRLEAHTDFLVNQKAEEEVRIILEHLDGQTAALERICALLEGSSEGRAADPPPDRLRS